MIVLRVPETGDILIGSSEHKYYPFVIKKKTSKMFGRGLKYFVLLFNGRTYMQYLDAEEAIQEAKQEYRELITSLYNGLGAPCPPPCRNESGIIEGVE